MSAFYPSVFAELKELRVELGKSANNATPMISDAKTTAVWCIRFLKDLPLETIEQFLKINDYSQLIELIIDNNEVKCNMEKACQEMVSMAQNEGRKNLSTSRDFMKQADEFCGQFKYRQALDLINKAILHAPWPDDANDEIARDDIKNYLSSCLARRFSINQAIDKIQQSYADVQNAIKYATDQRIKAKLICEREKLIAEHGTTCKGNQKIDLEEELAIQNLVEKFETESTIFDDHGLRIGYSQVKDRMIVADKRFNFNELLLNEEPYSVWLAPFFWDTYCSHCLQPLQSRPFPCRSCVYMRYCSSKCSEKAWTTYHSKECKWISALKWLSIGHHALRAILITGIDEALDIYRKSREQGNQNIKKKTLNRTFEDILTLTTHFEKRADKNKLTLVACSAFMTIMANTMGLINEHSIVDFGGLILNLSAVFTLNALAIPDMTRRSYHVNSEIGSGLYFTVSLFNHSCIPNTVRLFDGSKAIVRSNRIINPGEEITISYGLDKSNSSLKARQKFLMSKFFFKCTCTACMEDWIDR